MPTVRVSVESVKQSIEYFKSKNFAEDDMFFLFLMSKHLGVTSSYPVTFLTGNLTDSQKDEYLNTLWLLAGLFDSNEICGQRGILFPTGFRKISFFQPATEFKKIVGRAKDTIEKKNINVPIYNDRDSMLTLKSNYRELIKDNYLNGEKLSLSNLAAWVYRFTEFEFETTPNEKQFTRVVERAIKKFFRITKNDFLWLFEDDLSLSRIEPASSGITGAQLRGMFEFDAGKAPEIQTSNESAQKQKSVFGKNIVSNYLALNGDNPSNEDILNILKNKKQIVLTGVPGVGKSRYTQQLCDNPFFDDCTTIQFHASYAYEDFIGSEILKTEIGGTYVTTRKGIFLKKVAEAQKNSEKNYLFVIDELNRGNIAEIFGETILALDRNYTVSLSREYEGISTLKLPENFYIVATMNTSDRNIAFLDLAIRRRFGFVPLLPNYDFLSEEVSLPGFDLGNILKIINQRIYSTLKDPELILGQSYFIPPQKDGRYEWNFDEFKNQFNFVVLPTLKEYSFNDPSAVNTIVGESLGDGIQDVDEFKIAFSAEFAV